MIKKKSKTMMKKTSHKMTSMGLVTNLKMRTMEFRIMTKSQKSQVR